jgi:ribosomal protein S18 acetylase RimI-like enzyme
MTPENASRLRDPHIVYRDAVVKDGLAIARVWVAAWQAAYAGLMPAAYLAGLDANAAVPIFERGLRANLSVLVVERDGEILGFSGYGASRDPDAGPGTCEVIAINLHPSSWRRGLGRDLLRETLQRLRAQGFSEATLWVLHGNARARQFYEAQGWRLDGAEKHDDTLTGFAIHEVRYRMALSDDDARPH